MFICYICTWYSNLCCCYDQVAKKRTTLSNTAATSAAYWERLKQAGHIGATAAAADSGSHQQQQ
jgi:hypothetical protein